MEELLGKLVAFSIFIFVIVIGLYIAISIFLNKFNKLIYKKGTAMAWIPVFNIYLLGKLAVNKVVGWLLVVCIFLTGSYKTTLNGIETTYRILPENISSIVSKLYNLAVFCLLIYAIIKYNQLKRSGIKPIQQTQQSSNQSQSLMNNQMQNANDSNQQDQTNNENNTNSNL